MPRFEAEPPQILRYRRSIIFDDEPSVSHIAQKKNDVEAILESALKKEKICMALQNSCGGEGRKSCSWEEEMKEYILRFP
jgi:hypothetical protein